MPHILIIFLLLHCTLEQVKENQEPTPVETKVTKELEESKYNEWKKENLILQKENSQKFLQKHKIKLDKSPLFYEDKISFGMTQIEVLEILGYSYKEIMEQATDNYIDSEHSYEPNFRFHFKKNTLYSISALMRKSSGDELLEALKYKYGKSKINSKLEESQDNSVIRVDEHTWNSNNTEIIGNFCYRRDRLHYNQFHKEVNRCHSVANIDILYRNKNITAIIEKEKAEIEANKIKEKAKNL